ncbi:unnamed protein product [Rhizoctonia solani]|uniref:RING-type E3 ubiquitin transferase n=1 Tax=Rhizoctonia solani TaxID=456999 RepID=A0A8H3HT94_9AGAM|nr:unnamed protein product [Rhizoctonia solani]
MNVNEETTFSAESYFETQPPPADLDDNIQGVKEFIDYHANSGRKIVLITSGGTTVPLELHVVRFLDNFSAGTRGATSAEYFLKAGYAVIFMHRQFSLQPFSRHYSHTTNPFLDFLELDPPAEGSSNGQSTITVAPSKRAQLAGVLATYQEVHRANTLHTLTFVTINDYLYLLRGVSNVLKSVGRKGMYYLAAAVSDFFVPRKRLSEHKIQSRKGSLIIEMDQVPKILKPLVKEWTSGGFVVSFKLETDKNLLVPKARAALERYGHQVVVANRLDNRKYEVIFVTRTDQGPSSEHPEFKEETIGLRDSSSEIEEDIVAKLASSHDQWISGGCTGLATTIDGLGMPLATITTNRLLLYGAVSTTLASLAVYTTFSTHSNFYSAVVHLSRSNGSILTLANFMVFVALMMAKFMQLIFFGSLRANEVERLYDRTWYFLTESLLAFTIFREDFDAAFVCLFGGLLFVKSFHWILADRVEAMDQQPYPGPPKSFHIRTLALFNLLALVDVVMIGSLAEVILHEGVDGLVLFVSEYAILLASLLNSWLKYLISVYDIYRASRRGGDDAPPWEHKSMYIFYVELLTDFLKLSTYLAFFLTVLTYYGLPLNIIRDVFLTARSFIGRVRDLLRYRAATRDMDQRYPDALPAEMEALGDRTCIICREEMVSRGTAGVGAVTGGPNTTPKKLPCGHIFHFHCLRSWLERQQSCPTCRRTVLEPGRPGTAANGNAANANPAAPNPPAGAGANPQGAVELFNRVWNAPGQGLQQPAAPAANGPAPPPLAPPFGQLPAFPWHAGQMNQLQWPPQAPRQFQGFNAGGQWHPWGAPAENERGQRPQEDPTPTRTAPLVPGSGLTASPAPLDRDGTTTQPGSSSSNPPPPAPTPVRQVIPVPNKTPPEAKEAAKPTDSNETPNGSGTGASAREAAALAALRRFQAGRSTESLKSPSRPGSKPSNLTATGATEFKPTPRTSPSSPSGSIGAPSHNALQDNTEAIRVRVPPNPGVTSTGAPRAHAPNLIPLYNPGLSSPGLGTNMAIPSPYFLPSGSSTAPLIDLRSPPDSRSPPYLSGSQTDSRPSTLPRHGQLPTDISDTQLRQLDRVTRETIDERLRVLENVQTTVWQCVEELTRLRSSLPDPGQEERRGSSGSGGGHVGSTDGSTSSFETEAFVPPNIQVETTEGPVDADVKGKGKAPVETEVDDAPVVDTDVVDTQ